MKLEKVENPGYENFLKHFIKVMPFWLVGFFICTILSSYGYLSYNILVQSIDSFSQALLFLCVFGVGNQLVIILFNIYNWMVEKINKEENTDES